MLLLTIAIIFFVSFTLWVFTQPLSRGENWALQVYRSTVLRLLCLLALITSVLWLPVLLRLGCDTWEQWWKQNWGENLYDAYAGMFEVLRRGYL